jgi:hypothetical protein
MMRAFYIYCHKAETIPTLGNATRFFVSKIKSPRDKKTLSLKRDRRNTYGENPAASRKGIRRGKQRSHMGERRAVSQILSHLRERAEEHDATEADVLAKETIVKSKHKAFKKSPDSPLGVVIKKKLAMRAKQTNPGVADAVSYSISFQTEEVFDTLYNATLHKRLILRELQYLTGISRWRRLKKKSRRIGWYEREAAARLKEAILRDAPLLKGFFAEEPTWREKIFLWCEKALMVDSGSNQSQ